MPTKTHNEKEMNVYQLINHAARNNKPADEILKLCRGPMAAVMSADTTHGPHEAVYTDAVIALWAIAARLQDAERDIETLKRKARRNRQSTSSKPQPELLKKEPEEMTAEQENNEAFLHAREKPD